VRKSDIRALQGVTLCYFHSSATAETTTSHITTMKITLTIMLATGKDLSFEVGSVEQAILAFRKLSPAIANVGAFYQVDGGNICHIR
jgi:hypothetical protein